MALAVVRTKSRTNYFELPSATQQHSFKDWQFAEMVQQAQRGGLDCSPESRLLLEGFSEVSASHAVAGYARQETRDRLVDATPRNPAHVCRM